MAAPLPITAPVANICKREGAHRIFVATRILTENPSTVTVIAICTSCGEHFITEYHPKGEIIAFGDDTPRQPPPK